MRQLLVICFLAALIAALAAADVALKRPHLPDQFIVTTGTTMPFPDADPVAQSGAIYFDRRNGQMRIDTFWMGTQRSFIADTQRGRAHIISGGSCVTSYIKGKLVPVAVPAAAARDHDVNAVRGVNVDRYHHVVRDDDLVHIDYFFRLSNFTVPGETGEAADYWVPWRVTSRRVERQEMIAAPERPNPNWRFFGEPIDDAIVRFGGSSRALTKLTRGLTVTVDFFNFVPMAPDPNVFETPEALCSDPPSATHKDDLELFQVQRQMTELSFNNEAGHRIMTQIWSDHDRELAAGDADKTPQEQPKPDL